MDFVGSVQKLFLYYKKLGEKAMDQVEEPHLFVQANEDCNSIAIIVQHLYGNMVSRWTDVLSTDGEKPWRNRDQEFEKIIESKEELLQLWNNGWECLFGALDSLKPEDLDTVIYIRNEGQTVQEAILRQLAHYPYHIGQMVHIAKELKSSSWNSLSIARHASKQHNDEKFSQEKGARNFMEGNMDRVNNKKSKRL